MNVFMKQKQTHRHRAQACGCQGGGGKWRGGAGLADDTFIHRMAELKDGKSLKPQPL